MLSTCVLNDYLVVLKSVFNHDISILLHEKNRYMCICRQNMHVNIRSGYYVQWYILHLHSAGGACKYRHLQLIPAVGLLPCKCDPRWGSLHTQM